MVARCEHPTQHNIPNSTLSSNCTGAYIKGDYKIILGEQYYGFWAGPIYPNASTNHALFDFHVDCGDGCLFDIRKDPSETVDLAPSMPGLLADLRARYFAHNATQFDAPPLRPDPAACKTCVCTWSRPPCIDQWTGMGSVTCNSNGRGGGRGGGQFDVAHKLTNPTLTFQKHLKRHFGT